MQYSYFELFFQKLPAARLQGSVFEASVNAGEVSLWTELDVTQNIQSLEGEWYGPRPIFF